MFLDLDDVTFSILRYLDVRSLLNLSATCHRFQTLVEEKTVWLDALENIQRKRPVPLAYWEQSSRSASASLSLERLKSAVIRAAKLEHSWSKPTIRPSRLTRETFTLGENGDHLRWVWNLRFCGILLVYTANNCFTSMFSATGQRVTFQTGIAATCFDFDVDSQGITLIFNVADGQEEVNMEIHRIKFADFTHRLVKEVPTRGHVHSNFLEDELAGCILSSDGPTYEIVIVNWCTGKSAKINTEIEVKVSTIVYYWHMKEYGSCQPGEEPYVTMLAPHESHHIHYIDQGLPPRFEPSIWHGPGGPPSHMHCPRAKLLKVDDTKTLKVVSRKSFIYHLPGNSILSTGLGFHYLHDFGYQGKHAVWIEKSTDGEGAGATTCRLATFNHEDDSLDTTVSGETSALIFEDEDFSWSDVCKIQLDDQSEVLICFTKDEIWKLYFD